MGTRAAPTVANLVMGDFEKTHIYTYHLQPLLWIHYIDDIFMIWPHGKQPLLEYVQHLNSVHHSLKFTCESSELSLPMLDMMIIKDQSGILCTTYILNPPIPTPTCIMRHVTPIINKQGDPTANSWGSDAFAPKTSIFESNFQNIIAFYKSRNYPEQLLQEHLDKVKRIPRTTLLTINEESETPGEFPLVCVSTYHPLNPPVKDILNKNWPTLLIDTKLQCVSDKRVVFGHKRIKNLHDILVNSKISYPPKDRSTLSPQVINRTKICNNAKCRYCPKLDLSGMTRSTTTGRTYIRPQRNTCKFNNLIYLITAGFAHCNM